jgi:hypothetical protein
MEFETVFPRKSFSQINMEAVKGQDAWLSVALVVE